LHLTPRQRADIIHLCQSTDLTQQQIAARLDVNQSTVSRTIAHWNETGDLREHLSGGHQPIYDDDHLYRLDCLITQHPNATAAALLQMMGSLVVSAHTINNYRHVLDYTRRRPVEWEVDTARTVALRDAWAEDNRQADIPSGYTWTRALYVYVTRVTMCGSSVASTHRSANWTCYAAILMYGVQCGMTAPYSRSMTAQ